MPFDLSSASPGIRSGGPIFQNTAATHAGLEMFLLWSVLIILVVLFYSLSALLVGQWDMEAAKQVTYIVSANNHKRVALTNELSLKVPSAYRGLLTFSGVIWESFGSQGSQLGCQVHQQPDWVDSCTLIFDHSVLSMSVHGLVFICSHLWAVQFLFGLRAEDGSVLESFS